MNRLFYILLIILIAIAIAISRQQQQNMYILCVLKKKVHWDGV